LGQPDTGVPDPVIGYDVDRVLRAPASGLFQGEQPIGAQLVPGDLIARVDGSELRATFPGVLRGLLHDGLRVEQGVKVGDLDPRGDPSYCRLISDKSLAIGGGVLEALLSRPEIRARLGG
jgi:xanthine dehydrogenase accessory factor